MIVKDSGFGYCRVVGLKFGARAWGFGCVEISRVCGKLGTVCRTTLLLPLPKQYSTFIV